MLSELFALLEQPALLIIILLVGGLIGIGIEKFSRWQNRQKWQRHKARPGEVVPLRPRHDTPAAKVPDAASQLRTVMGAKFEAQRLLNKSEARLFRAIDKMVMEMAPPGWQVMAQVSLGEILRSEDKDAYACINSKRVDLLIVDADCQPLQAIEYQGSGHFKGAHATAARDAVKKEALRRAGVGYLEVVGGEVGPAELRRLLGRLIEKAPASLASCLIRPHF